MAGDSTEDYHGIIIMESLSDKSILDSLKILGRKDGRIWTMLRVGVETGKFQGVIKSISRNLMVVNGIPYYAHFYRRNELIVVFPGKIFFMTPDKETWQPVLDFGKSNGIPEQELDFFPCRFEDETY
ncbi:MAG: hypothetical protein M1476_05925 [Candidatus Thermoplasmatota archaeon]|nr:hypothetical protein [Candidatus Thermoplasmatota archaeon]